MNIDEIEGQWNQLAGKARVEWGKLTDNDLTIDDANTVNLEGRVQERYGIARDEARRQVKEFSSRL